MEIKKVYLSIPARLDYYFVIVLAAILVASCAAVPAPVSEQPAAAEEAPAEADYAEAAPAESGGTAEGSALSLEEAISRAAAAIKAKLPAGAHIAVVNFSALSQAMSDYLFDELSDALVNAGLTVTTRDSLKYVYKEQGFQQSGDVDDETAVSLGKMLGAAAVIKGGLVDTGASLRLRIVALNTENARQELALRLAVRNDREFAALLAALNSAPAVSKDADYGE
jgi:TolB-like protein